MHIRTLQPNDWPAVKTIYEQGIATRVLPRKVEHRDPAIPERRVKRPGHAQENVDGSTLSFLNHAAASGRNSIAQAATLVRLANIQKYLDIMTVWI